MLGAIHNDEAMPPKSEDRSSEIPSRCFDPERVQRVSLSRSAPIQDRLDDMEFPVGAASPSLLSGALPPSSSCDNESQVSKATGMRSLKLDRITRSPGIQSDLSSDHDRKRGTANQPHGATVSRTFFGQDRSFHVAVSDEWNGPASSN